MSKEQKKTGMISDKGDYKVEIKYSPEAIEKRLIRFHPKEGTSFEISADNLIELLSHYVNGQELSPAFVDTERIKVVYVDRQMKFKAEKDIKEGEEFNVAYTHPYPLEFAIIEEGFNIAKIRKDREGFVVTSEMLKEVKRKTPKSSKNFVQKFFKSISSLKLGGST